MIYRLTAPLISDGIVTAISVVRPRLTVKRIQDVVASFYHVTTHEMTSARQTKELVNPRHVAMHLSRQLTQKSFPDIGRLFNRDHTSVIHGVRRIERLMASDSDLAADVEVLRERLAA